MGNKHSQITSDEVIGSCIDNIYLIEPYTDSVDYENYYTMDGEIVFDLINTYSNQSQKIFKLKCYYYYEYHKNMLETDAIKTENNKSIDITHLKNKIITGLEKKLLKKRHCFNTYYYLLTLEDMKYKLYINRYSILEITN